MIKNIRAQINILIRSKPFIIALTIMILFTAFVFFINCIKFFGEPKENIMAAKYLLITSNLQLSSWFYALIFPILPAVPFAASYFDDSKNKASELCLIRTSVNKYYYSKMIAVFISGFAVILIPLLLDFILKFIAFPFDSVVTAQNFSILNSQIFKQDIIDTLLFKKLFCENMYLYNLLFILLNSAFAGLSAVITYQISFFYNNSKIILLCIFFVVYHFGSLLMSKLITEEFNAANYILSSYFCTGQTLRGFIIVYAAMVAAVIIPIPFAKRKLGNSL